MTEQGQSGSSSPPKLVGNSYPSSQIRGAVEFKYQPDGVFGESVPCATVLAQYDEATHTTSLTAEKAVRVMADGESSVHGPSVKLELAIRGRYADEAFAPVAEGAAGILFAVAELPPAPLPALEPVLGLVELPLPAADAATTDEVSRVHAYQQEGHVGELGPYVQISVRRSDKEEATEFVGGSPQQQDSDGQIHDVGPDTTISLMVGSRLESPDAILARMAQTLFAVSGNLTDWIS